MFRESNKQHMIIIAFMVALLFGGGVKYGRYLSQETQPITITPDISVMEAKENVTEISEIKVHVVGAVANPGVYTLKEGERVQDAVKMAQPLNEANLEAINLAKKLLDQERIIVPFVELNLPVMAENQKPLVNLLPKEQGVSGEIININTATESELQTLTGIGPSKARAIVQYRMENGLFSVIEDIQKVSGIGSGTFDKIKSNIRAF